VQEDDDSHYIALQMIQDLMLKSRDSFLDYFAQLGIFRKVLNLCGPQSDDEEDKVILVQYTGVRLCLLYTLLQSTSVFMPHWNHENWDYCI